MLKFQSETNLGLLAIQEPRHYIESNDKIPKQQTQGCRLVTLNTQSKGWFIIRANFIRPGWLLMWDLQGNNWLPSSSSVSIGNSGP